MMKARSFFGSHNTELTHLRISETGACLLAIQVCLNMNKFTSASLGMAHHHRKKTNLKCRICFYPDKDYYLHFINRSNSSKNSSSFLRYSGDTKQAPHPPLFTQEYNFHYWENRVVSKTTKCRKPVHYPILSKMCIAKTSYSFHGTKNGISGDYSKLIIA